MPKQRHRAWYRQYSRPETDLSAKTFTAAMGLRRVRAKHPDQGIDRVDSEKSASTKLEQKESIAKTHVYKICCPAMDCRTGLLLVRSAYQICQK
jgi:hypothetical protein